MKRSISIVTVMGLIGALALVPLGAAAAPKPSITDIPNDANFINDQGTGDGSFGDIDAGADASSFADLLEVIFTNDKKNLVVHIVTESNAPPAVGEGFRVRVNADGPGGVHCLNFEVFFQGAQNNLTGPIAHLRDACAANETIEAESGISPFGGIMITVPRKSHEGLGKGKKLTAPQAQSFVWSGSTYPSGVAGPYLDTTKVGTDYKLKK